jgi:hypothetical protein
MTFTATTVPILGMYNANGAFPTPGASAWNSGPTTNITGAYFGFYSGFQSDVASFISKCNSNSLVPFVELEPWFQSGSSVVAVLFSAITGGSYDTALTAIGSAIAASSTPVILTFAHEFNVSGQYPWAQNANATLGSGKGSGTGGADLTASQWIAGWTYVKNKVNSTAGGNALWMWACSAFTGGTTISPSAYWPSSALPQMVGIDGYPDTTYGQVLGTFAGQIQPTVSIIRGLGWTNPIYISETNLAQMVASGGETITNFVADMFNAGISGIFEFEESYEPDMTAAQWNEYNTAVATYYGTTGTGTGGTGGGTGGTPGTGGLVTTYTQTLYDGFPGTTLNSSLWVTPLDTSGISVSGGSLKVKGLTGLEDVLVQTSFTRDLSTGIFALQLTQSGAGVNGTMWFLGIADNYVSMGGNAYEFQTFPAGGSGGGAGSWYPWAFSGTDVSAATGASNILAPSVWVNGHWLGIGNYNLNGNNDVHVYQSADAVTWTEIASWTVTGAINEAACGFYFGTNYDTGTSGTSTYLATIQNVSWFTRGTAPSGGGGSGGSGSSGGGGALVHPAAALAPLYPSARLPGPRLRGFLPASAYKAQAQPVISNAATFVDDDALLIQLVANAVYRFKCVLGYTGNTSGAGDIDLTWALPSGATMGYSLYSYKTGVATAGFWQTALNQSLNTNGAGVNLAAVMKGSVQTASTPGTMQLTWKQNTSNATATQVLAGSSLLAWRIQ